LAWPRAAFINQFDNEELIGKLVVLKNKRTILPWKSVGAYEILYLMKLDVWMGLIIGNVF
jgi:hypothetical protein